MGTEGPIGPISGEPIIPDDFVETMNERVDRQVSTVAEALKVAEQAESSTPVSELKGVCPNCGSRRVRTKQDHISLPNKKDTKHKCTTCLSHFDGLADPTEVAKEEKSTSMTVSNTGFEWIGTDELADPEERGDSRVLRGLSEKQEIELAIRLYKPWTGDGPSYRELAQLIPWSSDWIGTRVREWKDGDHRGLVEDPTPSVDATGGQRAVADGGGQRGRWAAYGSG